MFKGSMNAGEITIMFGSNIKFYRNLKRWSQEVLAEKVGVSKNTICEIETGKKFVHVERLSRFSEVFNIDVHKLFMSERDTANDAAGVLANISTELKEVVDDIVDKYMDNMKK